LTKYDYMTDKKQLYILLSATTTSAFLTPFMGSAVNVALPIIAKELSMTALAISWVATAFLLAAAITLVPLGRLADIYGRKRIFLYGAIIFTAASLLCIWSTAQTFLIVMRAIQGIGGAMIFSTGTAMLVSAYPPGDRGKILGINIAAVYIGLTVGPFIGGLLTEHWGWRYIFVFTAVLGAIVIVLTTGMINEEWVGAKGERFDFAGSLLYGAALFALMYGLSLIPSRMALLLIALGLICFVFFVLRQFKIPYPLLNIRIFLNNRVFAFSNLAALINYLATFAVTFLLSLYLQHIKMLTPSQTGLVLVAEPIVQAFFSPLAGRLSDRYEPRIISSIGMALNVVGLIPLIFIHKDTSILYIVICLIILGMGFALFSSPNVNATMSSVENKFYGIASATLGTMRLVGQMLSMGITMLVFAMIIGNHAISETNSPLLLHSTKIIFIILAVICTAGIFASLARGRVHEK
jgi:EmrB/QacA subfamily drug resistance transporter